MFEVQVAWNIKDMGPIFREAVVQTAKVMRVRSRADIAAGVRGKYSRGYWNKVEKIAGGYKISETVRPAYVKVWEYGGRSVAKPGKLLWIPVSPNKTAIKKWSGGKLIRPAGKRVLMTEGSTRKIRGMAGTGSGVGKVQYLGIKSMTHRKRFHLRQIATEEANNFSKHWGELLRR
jgi:hypothetical protein